MSGAAAYEAFGDEDFREPDPEILAELDVDGPVPCDWCGTDFDPAFGGCGDFCSTICAAHARLDAIGDGA